jgi:hypothetical protein
MFTRRSILCVWILLFLVLLGGGHLFHHHEGVQDTHCAVCKFNAAPADPSWVPERPQVEPVFIVASFGSRPLWVDLAVRYLLTFGRAPPHFS